METQVPDSLSKPPGKPRVAAVAVACDEPRTLPLTSSRGRIRSKRRQLRDSGVEHMASWATSHGRGLGDQDVSKGLDAIG